VGSGVQKNPEESPESTGKGEAHTSLVAFTRLLARQAARELLNRNRPTSVHPTDSARVGDSP
jgi:hypothetical protein